MFGYFTHDHGIVGQYASMRRRIKVDHHSRQAFGKCALSRGVVLVGGVENIAINDGVK